MIVQFNPFFAQMDSPISSMLVLSIGLVILMVVMWVVISAVRKRLSPTKEAGGTGFTLSDIRALRQKGAISEEEFNRAKAKIAQSLQAAHQGKPNDGKSQL
jgi:hypothetical protein